jgi:hypothetical protein
MASSNPNKAAEREFQKLCKKVIRELEPARKAYEKGIGGSRMNYGQYLDRRYWREVKGLNV